MCIDIHEEVVVIRREGISEVCVEESRSITLTTVACCCPERDRAAGCSAECDDCSGCLVCCRCMPGEG